MDKTLLQNAYNDLQKQPTSYIKTGFREIDEILSYAGKGSLITIGARPLMGKTAFALNLLEQFCMQGKKCLYFTHYSTKELLIQRLLKLNANVKFEQTTSKDELQKITMAIKRISKWKLHVVEVLDFNLAFVEQKIKKLKPDYVFIDSIQDFQIPLKDLKMFVQSCDTIFFITSQLKRLTETRKNHYPKITDLKASKSLIKLSDEVLLLYRPYYYDCNAAGDEKDTIYVIGTKRFNGSTALKYNCSTGKITDKVYH